MIIRRSFCWCILFVLFSVSSSAGTYDANQSWVFEDPAPLVNIQLAEPGLVPKSNSTRYGCVHTTELMVHVFASSYGKPFIGNYTPPPCSFNRVTMNLTVDIKGTQFDRLGIMYLGDVEVFRTSSAEPTYSGITWTYLKAMEHYTALWKGPQKIIFDWPNNVDRKYTGALKTVLTATFYSVPDSLPTADQIIPISAKRSSANKGSAFMVPGQQASLKSTFPGRIKRAVVSLSATGQQDEEFWYFNVFDKDRNTFQNSIIGDLKGHSPFREVQLFIDGQLAGVHWPFPVIFTGGISPSMWRPIAGIDAFDLRQHEIDITPFVSTLWDGAEHTIEIKVVGLNDDGTFSREVGGWWFITGTIFLFLDKEKRLSRRQDRSFGTLGISSGIIVPAPVVKMESSKTTDSEGRVYGLIYNTTVHRSLLIQGRTPVESNWSGEERVFWTQELYYTSYNYFSDHGHTQHTIQHISGTDLTHNEFGYNNTYSYPLEVNSTILEHGVDQYTMRADLKSGLEYSVKGRSVFPTGLRHFNITAPYTLAIDGITSDSASQISTLQKASSELFFYDGAPSYGTGTLDQVFDFKASKSSAQEASTELYHRHVKAANSMLIQDEETLLGHTIPKRPRKATNITVDPSQDMFAANSPQAVLGRGPGQARRQLLGVDTASRRQLLGIGLPP